MSQMLFPHQEASPVAGRLHAEDSGPQMTLVPDPVILARLADHVPDDYRRGFGALVYEVIKIRPCTISQLAIVFDKDRIASYLWHNVRLVVGDLVRMDLITYEQLRGEHGVHWPVWKVKTIASR